MTGPGVRRAKVNDAGPLAQLAEDTFRATFTGTTSTANMDAHCAGNFGPQVQRAEIADPGLVTLLAEIGHDLVGFAQLRRSAPKSCVSACAPTELYRIYVADAWHGKGVAQALMDEALANAREFGADAIWLGVWEHNTKAVSFYRKYGFERVGEHPYTMGADVQTDLVMARAISLPCE